MAYAMEILCKKVLAELIDTRCIWNYNIPRFT